MSTGEKNTELEQLLTELDPSWKVESDVFITRRFNFSNFDQVMQFVNQVAQIANEYDHHPDVQFGYGYCVVKYTTHDSGGLTVKDFQCAKRIDEI